MKRKKNNNLVVLKYEDGEKKYFTSMTRAGFVIGLANNSVKWAIDHENTIVDMNDRKLRIVLEDGSEIPYKYINNN